MGQAHVLRGFPSRRRRASRSDLPGLSQRDNDEHARATDDESAGAIVRRRRRMSHHRRDRRWRRSEFRNRSEEKGSGVCLHEVPYHLWQGRRARRSSEGDSNTETESEAELMVEWFARFKRLCRLMCGRSLTFRLGISKTYRGSALTRGAAPEQNRSRLRWGKAATAHQAAKPHSDFAELPIESRAGAFVFVGAVIALTLVTVLNSRASGSMQKSLTESLPAEFNQEQMQFPEGLDYGKFMHSSRNHSRLPCLLCHRRESNSPIPKRPGGSGHLPCAGCHAQQFSSPESPICTICHTDVKSGALKSFPRLKSFRMKFDHSLHLKMGSVSCATCHSPASGGVAL